MNIYTVNCIHAVHNLGLHNFNNDETDLTEMNSCLIATNGDFFIFMLMHIMIWF